MSVSKNVVIDACVLCNFTLCDLILRLAESTDLFIPRWSERIIGETLRTLRNDLNWEERLVLSYGAALRKHFASAWVSKFEALEKVMSNDPKDRHVAAAAVKCKAPIIVTQNVRHFPSKAIEPHGIKAFSPDEFLQHLLSQKSELVIRQISEIASKRDLSIKVYLKRLAILCPGFADKVQLNLSP